MLCNCAWCFEYIPLPTKNLAKHTNRMTKTQLCSILGCRQNSLFYFFRKTIKFREQRMNKKGDHRPRNSAQHERVVELLIMHKAKWTPRQIPLLPSVSRPRSIIRQLLWDFRSCLMIDLGRETDGNTHSNGICLGVHFASCIKFRERNFVQSIKTTDIRMQFIGISRIAFHQKARVFNKKRSSEPFGNQLN